MTKETIGEFEVEIVGTQITALHREHGHRYSANWYQEVPHLTNRRCRPNDRAERSYESDENAAWDAMHLKLERDELI